MSAEHERMAETVVIAAAAPDHDEISSGQREMTHQLTLLRRWVKQLCDLGFAQSLSWRHPCLLALMPTDHPIRARESISVLRLTPKVRQTAALVAPPSRAVITAPSFSASMATGRPPRRPRRRAAARPASPAALI